MELAKSSSRGLFQLNMPVRDLDRAIPFYRDILGLELRAERPGLAFFATGTTRLLVERVGEAGGRYAHPGSILYFAVDDIHAACAELRARGVEFVEMPNVVSRSDSGETWMAFFSDGDWNTHAVVEQRPATPVPSAASHTSPRSGSTG